MATTYPYVASPGAIVKAIEQFRKAFPARVTAEVLQKFSIAPANESYVISLFRFLGFIDQDGNKQEDNVKFFYGSDEAFTKGLEAAVRQAYSTLFDEHGKDAWTEDRQSLATWFRVTDQSSELVGGRQAGTFLTLAALAGYGEPPKASSAARASAPKAAKDKPKVTSKTSKSTAAPTAVPTAPGVEVGHAGPSRTDGLGLSVRIEVNLPAGGTPEVYDSIFASIRKHLIDP